MSEWRAISERGNDAEIRAFIDKMDRLDEQREQRLSAPEALAQAALWYAQQGIPVFPLQPASKEPMPGSRGFYDATTDTDQVRTWWTDRPDANIGSPTGVVFDVIDIDGPEGFGSLATMREEGVDIRPVTLETEATEDTVWVYATSYTPNRGGRHFFIETSARSSSPKIRPGIDYKGAGGYVVMPPSRWPGGGRYDWVGTPHLDELKG